jgi:hypothetical protein
MKTECMIGQMFGGNMTSTYKEKGWKGHTGIDNQCGFGTPIHSYFDQEYVYKVLTKSHPANDGSGFTGVFTIVDNGIEVFEFLYGHCDPSVNVGDTIKKGTIIATEANNGEVYQGGERITLAMQRAGDKRGAHRHDQKRPVYKVKELSTGEYLTAPGGGLYQDAEGYYYKHVFQNNGYSGCVNWIMPFLNRNLTIGMSGYDVGCLQRFLKARGFFEGETTEYFGTKTLASVIAFQKANGITPLLGFVGPTTRGLINNILS